jgi:hypothetical protein
MARKWIKSSRCGNVTCVEAAFESPCSDSACVDTAYVSACGTGTCVEVSHRAPRILVRDSKNPGGPVLEFGKDEWRAFVWGIRRGEMLFGVLDEVADAA